MTHSVFVALLIGFGVTTLLRRGVRVAAFYAVPLGAIYLPWYLAYGRESTVAPARLTGEAVGFFRRLLWAAFESPARAEAGALVLLIVAVVGLAAALRRDWRSGTWAEAPLPVGVFIAWLAFAGMTAVGRAETEVAPTIAGRLLHVSVALALRSSRRGPRSWHVGARSWVLRRWCRLRSGSPATSTT